MEAFWDKTHKVAGWVTGNLIMNAQNKLIGYFEGHSILNAQKELVGFVIASSVFDRNYKLVGFVENGVLLDANRQIIGIYAGREAGIGAAAYFLLFPKAEQQASVASVEQRRNEVIAVVAPERQFTIAELAEFNGQAGKPAYVAVNGIVYDVTGVPAWQSGTHFGLTAGKEFTAEYLRCHQQNMTILAQLPRVGVLAKQEE